jgi:hypothetical protein
MMGAIAVLALNFVAALACFSSESRAVLLCSYQCALMAVAAQAGLYRAYRGRHRRRLFWLGFTASGLLAALSLVAWIPGIAGLWRPYFSWEEGLFNQSPEALFNQSPEALRIVVGHRGLHSLVSVLVYFAPQLVVAVAGGLLTVGAGEIFTRKGPRARSASAT